MSFLPIVAHFANGIAKNIVTMFSERSYGIEKDIRISCTKYRNNFQKAFGICIHKWVMVFFSIWHRNSPPSSLSEILMFLIKVKMKYISCVYEESSEECWEWKIFLISHEKSSSVTQKFLLFWLLFIYFFSWRFYLFPCRTDFFS